jgi:AraC family transcriptional regulator, transcriptional activator of pobA
MHFLGRPAPSHPLIALIDYDNMPADTFEKGIRISLDFYKISFKDKFTGKVRYGQGYYEFEEGGLAFIKPKQIVVASEMEESYEGYALFFHPDLIRHHPLATHINQYGFFSYDVAEALFLSAKEKNVIAQLFSAIASELENNIDNYSQNVLVSQIELLLNHSDRFYNRQFITRKHVHHEAVAMLDKLLDEYFKSDQALQHGLPSVKYVSTALKLSPRYLSDMLTSLTGQNTQQYIQNKVIEYSKDLLSATRLSVSEVAYQLGFVHPQSFSKLFKAKMQVSPVEFRQSFE